MSGAAGENGRLPNELAALENRLGARARSGPPEDLRAAVLAAVARELDRPKEESGWSGWRGLLAAAAAVLVWINFSASVVHNMDLGLEREIAPDDLAAAARHVGDLAPDLTMREANRHTILLVIGAETAPAPAPRWSAGASQVRQGRETWDIR